MSFFTCLFERSCRSSSCKWSRLNFFASGTTDCRVDVLVLCRPGCAVLRYNRARSSARVNEWKIRCRERAKHLRTFGIAAWSKILPNLIGFLFLMSISTITRKNSRMIISTILDEIDVRSTSRKRSSTDGETGWTYFKAPKSFVRTSSCSRGNSIKFR